MHSIKYCMVVGCVGQTSSLCASLILVLTVTSAAFATATCYGQDAPGTELPAQDEGLFGALAEDGLPENLPTNLSGDEDKTSKKVKVRAAENEAKILMKEGLKEVPQAARHQFRTQILPALDSGSGLQLLATMEQLILRHSPETVEAIDLCARSLGYGSLRSHFSDALINRIEQGTYTRVNKIKPKFADYIESVLIDFIRAEIAAVSLHELMQDPLTLPDDWRESEQLFWEVHVWKNQFLNLDRLVKFAITMRQPDLDQAIKDNNQPAIQKFSFPSEMAMELLAHYRNLLEREAELRVEALAKAEKILRGEARFEDRINAAFALEMHGGELASFFDEYQLANASRPKLQDNNVITECQRLLESGRSHGKDVIEKAVLLRVGAHWWFRGRYGAAAEANGLLKPKAAMKSKYLMFGLFMPKERPKAIGFVDSETGDVTAGYDRRHFYTWAIEKRKLQLSIGTNKKTRKTGERLVGKKQAKQFW